MEGGEAGEGKGRGKREEKGRGREDKREGREGERPASPNILAQNSPWFTHV